MLVSASHFFSNLDTNLSSSVLVSTVDFVTSIYPALRVSSLLTSFLLETRSLSVGGLSNC
jgi:hypothetical protein